MNNRNPDPKPVHMFYACGCIAGVRGGKEGGQASGPCPYCQLHSYTLTVERDLAQATRELEALHAATDARCAL